MLATKITNTTANIIENIRLCFDKYDSIFAANKNGWYFLVIGFFNKCVELGIGFLICSLLASRCASFLAISHSF